MAQEAAGIFEPTESEFVVTVERDYSAGILTRFDETFPVVLQNRITQEQWDKTIRQINEYFKQAETLDYTTCCEGLLGFITLFSVYLCIDSNYSRIVKKLDKFLKDENERVYKERGLKWLNPLSNALLNSRTR